LYLSIVVLFVLVCIALFVFIKGNNTSLRQQSDSMQKTQKEVKKSFDSEDFHELLSEKNTTEPKNEKYLKKKEKHVYHLAKERPIVKPNEALDLQLKLADIEFLISFLSDESQSIEKKNEILLMLKSKKEIEINRIQIRTDLFTLLDETKPDMTKYVNLSVTMKELGYSDDTSELVPSFNEILKKYQNGNVEVFMSNEFSNSFTAKKILLKIYDKLGILN
jgi:hypothetical protein